MEVFAQLPHHCDPIVKMGTDHHQGVGVEDNWFVLW